ncbi:hypothetical protein B0H21DRAFT_180150 [Amylocystis lapponica]|nr:hypothetical protein B0H21DRAFT_180150 [Amylocystis lapponica]
MRRLTRSGNAATMQFRTRSRSPGATSNVPCQASRRRSARDATRGFAAASMSSCARSSTNGTVRSRSAGKWCARSRTTCIAGGSPAYIIAQGLLLWHGCFRVAQDAEHFEARVRGGERVHVFVGDGQRNVRGPDLQTGKRSEREYRDRMEELHKRRRSNFEFVGVCGILHAQPRVHSEIP